MVDKKTLMNAEQKIEEIMKVMDSYFYKHWDFEEHEDSITMNFNPSDVYEVVKDYALEEIVEILKSDKVMVCDQCGVEFTGSPIRAFVENPTENEKPETDKFCCSNECLTVWRKEKEK